MESPLCVWRKRHSPFLPSRRIGPQGSGKILLRAGQILELLVGPVGMTQEAHARMQGKK